MNSKPKISVIMPVYNTKAYLEDSVKSILNQTFEYFEFIIIDDCSTDWSFEILKKYSKVDSRIRLFRNKKNLWVVKTRNKLLNKISNHSKFIAVNDSDDISHIDRLKIQYDFLQNNKSYWIVWTNTIIINKNWKIIWYRKYPENNKKVWKIIIKKSPLAQPSVMIRKKIIQKIWFYNNEYERAQDYELRFRIFDNWYKLANIDKYLVKYRFYQNQWKSNHLKLTLKNTLKIQRKYIFTKKYFSIKNFIYHISMYFLFILPNSIILYLFQKLEYQDAK